MNKNLKKFPPFILAVTVMTTYLLVSPTETPHQVAVKKIKKQNIQKVVAKKIVHHQKSSRAIASIPSPQAPNKKREVVGKFSDIGSIRVINKENKDWKELYSKNFLRMLGDTKIKDFNVKLKKSILKVNNNIGQQMEHVIVSYTKPDGNPLSFEALIDSQTGSVVQTWNKTRYEFNKPAKLNSTGRKFYQD